MSLTKRAFMLSAVVAVWACFPAFLRAEDSVSNGQNVSSGMTVRQLEALKANELYWKSQAAVAQYKRQATETGAMTQATGGGGQQTAAARKAEVVDDVVLVDSVEVTQGRAVAKILLSGGQLVDRSVGDTVGGYKLEQITTAHVWGRRGKKVVELPWRAQ